MVCENHDELLKATYSLVGQVEATHKSIDEKFSLLFKKIDAMQLNDNSQDLKLEQIETNWKWTTKVAAAIGGMTGFTISLLGRMF